MDNRYCKYWDNKHWNLQMLKVVVLVESQSIAGAEVFNLCIDVCENRHTKCRAATLLDKL